MKLKAIFPKHEKGTTERHFRVKKGEDYILNRNVMADKDVEFDADIGDTLTVEFTDTTEGNKSNNSISITVDDKFKTTSLGPVEISHPKETTVAKKE